MRRALFAMAVFSALAGCNSGPAALDVDDAWIRLPAVPGRPAAAYFTVEGGETPDRLLGITSSRVATIELHEGGMKDGVMTMRPLPGVDIEAGGEAEFTPGGNHAMLFGIDPMVEASGKIPLAFRFKSGKTIQVDAKLVSAADDAPDHSAH